MSPIPQIPEARWPAGTVTFLFTDIEGSSALWETHPEKMRTAMQRHDVLAAQIVASHGGIIVKHRGEGDSLFVVFARASSAVEAAAALQFAFHTESWPEPVRLRVRMGLHSGEAHLRDSDYLGPTVNRCARLRSIAHGEQTIMSQTTADLVRDSLPALCSLRDRGMHRLKDLQRPEQVFQLIHSGLPAGFPPLRSLNEQPNNLPLQLTSFIGREREIAELRALLPATRLLTLTGVGGTGKTRLALQLAAETLDDCPDGVWFVELAPLEKPEFVPQAVATALGIRETASATSESSLLSALTDYLKSRSLLLILDNCEHLAMASARLVDTLLRTCPTIRILATSRTLLHVGGERQWRVPSLNLPEIDSDFRQTAESEAVRLFADRASHVSPGFALTPENAPDVVRICRRLDAIPFAVELAAARVTMLPVRQIADRLEKDFRILPRGPELSAPRHHTLKALIDWSYNLLTASEQVLLRRLSVFAGGWTLEAAEAVCADDSLDVMEIFDLLSALDHASLMVVETGDNAETYRYRLLETVRHYARGKLEEAEPLDALEARFIACFTGIAEEVDPLLSGRDQARLLRRLDAEQDNFRSALKLAVDAETRLRLAGALGGYWRRRGFYTEGRAWLSGALERTTGTSPRTRAKAHDALGVLLWEQGELAAARLHLEESLRLLREHGSPRSIGHALINRALLELAHADYTAAFAFFEESIVLLETASDRGGLATALNNMGDICGAQENDVGARVNWERALQIFRDLGDTANIASASNNLGTLAMRTENYKEARMLFEECLTQLRQLGIPAYVAVVEGNLAEVIHRMGDNETAQAMLVQNLRLRQDLGDVSDCIYPLSSLAKIAQCQGDLPRAVQLWTATEVVLAAVDTPYPPVERKEYDEHLDVLRLQLTDHEFENATKSAQARTVIETLDYACKGYA